MYLHMKKLLYILFQKKGGCNFIFSVKTNKYFILYENLSIHFKRKNCIILYRNTLNKFTFIN